MTYETTNLTKEQIKIIDEVIPLELVERLDDVTVNLSVDDENADALSAWLESHGVEHRMV